MHTPRDLQMKSKVRSGCCPLLGTLKVTLKSAGKEHEQVVAEEFLLLLAAVDRHAEVCRTVAHPTWVMTAGKGYREINISSSKFC